MSHALVGYPLLSNCSASGNILLDDHFVAKISDFGLTRASPTRSSVTMQTERIVGTRAYMAPEALRGEITPKSDVFSFGVVRDLVLSGHKHTPTYIYGSIKMGGHL